MKPCARPCPCPTPPHQAFGKPSMRPVTPLVALHHPKPLPRLVAAVKNCATALEQLDFATTRFLSARCCCRDGGASTSAHPPIAPSPATNPNQLGLTTPSWRVAIAHPTAPTPPALGEQASLASSPAKPDSMSNCVRVHRQIVAMYQLSSCHFTPFFCSNTAAASGPHVPAA